MLPYCRCSGAQSYLTLCDPWTTALQASLSFFAQTHVHWIGDAIQPSHLLSSLFPPAFNLSQHRGLSQWVSSLHQVAKVVEFQLQYQSFQWLFKVNSFRTDWFDFFATQGTLKGLLQTVCQHLICIISINPHTLWDTHYCLPFADVDAEAQS